MYYYYKSLVIYSIFLSSLINYITGGTIHRNTIGRHRIPDDMKVIESEDLPEMSRKDIIEILQKKQFFQDIFSEQPNPMVIQFGHVCENPNEWEQRFEQRNFNENHFQGKMRWGNKNGDYGEHYWDLGHAG